MPDEVEEIVVTPNEPRDVFDVRTLPGDVSEDVLFGYAKLHVDMPEFPPTWAFNKAKFFSLMRNHWKVCGRYRQKVQDLLEHEGMPPDHAHYWSWQFTYEAHSGRDWARPPTKIVNGRPAIEEAAVKEFNSEGKDPEQPKTKKSKASKVDLDPMDDVTFEVARSLKKRSDKTNLIDDIMWVYQNVANPFITAYEAPSLGAWFLLGQARKKPDAFVNNLLTKALTIKARIDQDTEEKLVKDSGQNAVDHLEQMLKNVVAES